MKKLIILVLTVIMLITLASCGETVICDGCDKEIKARQSKTKEWEGENLCLCVDCYDLIVAYENGKATECDFCNDIAKISDMHVNAVFGEPIYICPECYEEIKEEWN